MAQRKSAKSGKKTKRSSTKRSSKRSSLKRSSPKRSSSKRSSPKATRKATMSFDNASDQALWERFLAAQRRLEELAKVDLSKLMQSATEPVEVRRSVFVIGAPPPMKKSAKKKRKTSKKSKKSKK